MDFRIVSGDLMSLETEALITAINPNGDWYGYIDREIVGVAKDHYHKEPRMALRKSGLNDGSVIVARGNRKFHKGKFDHVIFVVDAFNLPLSKLVYSALVAAHQNDFQEVSLPVIRGGVAFGLVEKTYADVAREIKQGIKMFKENYPDSMLIVNLVIFRNFELLKYFVN